MEKIRVAIVDDHSLFSGALGTIISGNPDFEVAFICENGEELISQIKKETDIPDIILMDVNMPKKDGIETTKYVSKHFPDVKVVALTMEDSDYIVMKMIKAGAKGYLLKNTQPNILFNALKTVYVHGIFYPEMIVNKIESIKTTEYLKDRELDFIKYACSELTYKEIAEKMFVSPKTVDGYREAVFTKLRVKSRVGLALFATKNNMC